MEFRRCDDNVRWPFTRARSLSLNDRRLCIAPPTRIRNQPLVLLVITQQTRLALMGRRLLPTYVFVCFFVTVYDKIATLPDLCWPRMAAAHACPHQSLAEPTCLFGSKTDLSDGLSGCSRSHDTKKKI
jgi:hypothetical protein